MKNNNVLMGMDIHKEVSKMINEKESIITKGMSESETKAYKLGVKNTLSALSGLLNGFNDYFIMNADINYPCELHKDDFIKAMEG